MCFIFILRMKSSFITSRPGLAGYARKGVQRRLTLVRQVSIITMVVMYGRKSTSFLASGLYLVHIHNYTINLMITE